MLTQNHKKVASVCGMLQAVTVQGMLENAGIAALVELSNASRGMDLLVPEAQAEEADHLLHPERSFIVVGSLGLA